AAAEAFVQGGAWGSQIVLVETAWVLDAAYGRTPAQIASGLDLLLEHGDVVVESANVVRDALDAFRQHRSVGFSDCLILAVARRAGHLPLGTFDRRLARMDGTQRL